MKTKLFFFDNMYESANCTFRGLIAFISILVLYKILNYLDKKMFKIDYKIVFTALILCCCLGIIVPDNKNAAIAVGGLTFFLFFSLIFMYNNTSKNYINAIKFICAGIIIGCISNYLIWIIYWKTNLRIKGSNFKYILWHLNNVLLFYFLLKYYLLLQS